MTRLNQLWRWFCELSPDDRLRVWLVTCLLGTAFLFAATTAGIGWYAMTHPNAFPALTDDGFRYELPTAAHDVRELGRGWCEFSLTIDGKRHRFLKHDGMHSHSVVEVRDR